MRELLAKLTLHVTDEDKLPRVIALDGDSVNEMISMALQKRFVGGCI